MLKNWDVLVFRLPSKAKLVSGLLFNFLILLPMTLSAEEAVSPDPATVGISRLDSLEKRIADLEAKSLEKKTTDPVDVKGLENRIIDLEGKTLECIGGTSVKGREDRWSPWSLCPEGYKVTGLQRVDLLGDHKNPTAHVNDFQCSEQGCRAWCIGSGCTIEARCCR